ncbi:hypothetical protein BT63DRAFT_457015 [Microthyrium microscopicum]|uniref:RNase III domain-containing protein n=1 Tax=Microthyrium microscopicum TaxID=703497 RepID=A0A6A6U604_9PEZI|nr:hypothetical protein BT63DRAFT_457015 [Microthyrium microscopicum]
MTGIRAFMQKIQACERIIKYTFTSKLTCAEALNRDPLFVAFTMDGTRQRVPINQRLALLGDGMMRAHFCRKWYSKDLNSGLFDAIHNTVLNNKNLAAVGIYHGLQHCIHYPPSSTFTGRMENTMATTVEAILGASYIDGGETAMTNVASQLGLTHELLEVRSSSISPVLGTIFPPAVTTNLPDKPEQGPTEASRTRILEEALAKAKTDLYASAEEQQSPQLEYKSGKGISPNRPYRKWRIALTKEAAKIVEMMKQGQKLDELLASRTLHTSSHAKFLQMRIRQLLRTSGQVSSQIAASVGVQGTKLSTRDSLPIRHVASFADARRFIKANLVPGHRFLGLDTTIPHTAVSKLAHPMSQVPPETTADSEDSPTHSIESLAMIDNEYMPLPVSSQVTQSLISDRQFNNPADNLQLPPKFGTARESIESRTNANSSPLHNPSLLSDGTKETLRPPSDQADSLPLPVLVSGRQSPIAAENIDLPGQNEWSQDSLQREIPTTPSSIQISYPADGTRKSDGLSTSMQSGHFDSVHAAYPSSVPDLALESVPELHSIPPPEKLKVPCQIAKAQEMLKDGTATDKPGEEYQLDIAIHSINAWLHEPASQGGTDFEKQLVYMAERPQSTILESDAVMQALEKAARRSHNGPGRSKRATKA